MILSSQNSLCMVLATVALLFPITRVLAVIETLPSVDLLLLAVTPPLALLHDHEYDHVHATIATATTTTTATTTGVGISATDTLTNTAINTAINTATTAPNCTEWNANNRLECWLWQLKVDIPAQSFSADWLTVSIHHMACSHFSLGGLESHYATPHTLDLSIRTLQATCKGNYHASGGLSGKFQASVTQAASSTDDHKTPGHEALQLSFRLTPSRAHQVVRPDKFQTTECQTHCKATHIHFSGSASAKLIQTFSKTIGHYITQALQEQLCPLLPKQLDPLVTQYLHEFNEWIQPYLPPSSSSSSSSSISAVSASSSSGMATSRESTVIHHTIADKRRTKQRRLRKYPPSLPRTNRGDMISQNATTTITSTSTSTDNPVDWSVVHWTLDTANDQIQDHLQQGWLFHPNSSAASHCPKKCQEMFRGLSGWFRSIVGPRLIIPLPSYLHNISLPALPLDATGWIGIDRVSIQGLDTLDALQVIRPSNNRSTLQSRVSTTQGLQIEAPIVLTVQLANSQPALREPFTVQVNVTALETAIATAIQVHDWNTTSLLQVALALQRFAEDPTAENIQPTLGCLIRTLDQVHNLEWTTSAAAIDSITLTRRLARIHNQSNENNDNNDNDNDKTLEDDLDQVINRGLELVLDEYSDLWTLLTQGVVEGPLRQSLNRWVREWLAHHASDDSCPRIPSVSPTTPPRWVNFTKFLVLRQVNDFLNHRSTLHTMNQFLECTGNLLEGWATAGVSAFPSSVSSWTPLSSSSSSSSSSVAMAMAATGVFKQVLQPILPSQPIRTVVDNHPMSFRIGDSTASTSTVDDKIPPILRVSRLKTKHWNAIQKVQLLEPSGDTTLESSVQWGTNTTIPQVDVTLEIATEALWGTVNLTFFASLEAQVGTQMKYNLNTLQNLTLAHVLQHGACGILPLVTMRLLPDVTGAQFGPNGGIVGLNISAILNGNHSIYFSTNADEGSTHTTHQVPQMAGQALERSVEWVRTVFNQAMEEWLAQSSQICPGVIVPSNDNHNDDDDDDSNKEHFSWYDYPMLWMVLVMAVLGQYGLVWIAQGSTSQERIEREALQEPLLQGPRDDELFDPTPLEDDIDDSFLNDMRQMDQALLNDIRVEMEDDRHDQFIFQEQPFVDEEELDSTKILLTSPTVPAIVQYAIPILIVGTIVLLFSSNVSVGASVGLSIRLGDFSIHLPGLFEFSLGNTISELFHAGIYPLLFLVVVFSGIWPYAKLLWMLYIWVAPYTDGHKREERLLTLDALSKFSLVDTYVLVVMLVAFRFHLDLSEDLGLDVYVTPTYGFYAFLLATCLSLVLGHGMLYFHRNAQRAFVQNSIETEILIEKQSIFDHDFAIENNGPRRPLSRPFQLILFVSCLLAATLLMVGFGQKSFSFEFGGLAGMALGDKKGTTYSLISLGAAIPQSVENSGSAGIIFLQMAYYFYAVLTPIACLVLIMVLFMYPTSPRIQQRLLVAAEIANAWSAVEVFVLSIVAALFQISTFASFIIGDKCDLVNQIAATLVGGDIIPESDAICFSVEASVESNAWYLVAGVVLNSFIASLGLRLAHAAVDERLKLRPSGLAEAHQTVTLRLYRLPIGVVFFGEIAGASEEMAGRSGSLEDENLDDGNLEDENLDAPSPEWQFWF